jgi:hypothetical protein
MSVAERMQVAEKFTSSGLFPPEGVKIVRWDSTPDNWGILLVEAESEAAMGMAVNMWRAAGAGFFKVTKTAPATPVDEAIANTADMLEKLNAA